MNTNTLRPAALKLLAILQFRDHLGQTYGIPEPRGRVGLVVPTLMGTLERLTGVNRATVLDLRDAGLITVTLHDERPTYGQRVRPSPGTTCDRLTLTEAGRAYTTKADQRGATA